MIPREFIERSRATQPFRDAVAIFARDGRPSEKIRFDAYSPPVKVARTLAMMLREHPELEIERVEIEGASGCEFFRGELRIHAAGEVRSVSFHWDCKWKAMKEGWTDYFGFPDQTRAAREFGYDCFRRWEAAEPEPQLVVAMAC